MAHIRKFTAGSASRILGHCAREKTEKGYLKYRTGSDIDSEKTPQNYSFASGLPGGTGRERLNYILENTYHQNRKDLIVMADCVVTLPKDFEGDPKEFFKCSAKFLYDRYGADSCIGAYVHMDETTPHMHFCFVPRVYDSKRARWKVCAYKVITKSDLRSLHQDLEKYLNEHLKDPVKIQNGITKETGGNKTTAELKALQKEADDLKEEMKALDAENMAFKSTNEVVKKDNLELIRQNRRLKDEKSRLTLFVDYIKKRVKRLKPLVDRLNGLISEDDEKELKETIESIENATSGDDSPEMELPYVTARKERVR